MGSQFKTKLISSEVISMLGLSGMMLMWVIVLVLVSGVSCEDSSLPETVRTLKAQVSALLEDFGLLAKTSELLELREELAALRHELLEARQNNLAASSTTGNQQKNDHLTVQWLATTVSELRGEVTEVAASHNTSAELQRREELNSELGLLRGDVASVRKDFEELQATQQRGAIALAQAEQDIMDVKTQAQNVAAVCADTRNQFQTAQTEWSLTIKSLKKSPRTGKTYKALGNEETEKDGKYRHHRVLRMQMAELDMSAKKLSANQVHLDHQVRRLEKQMKTVLSSHHGRGGGNHDAGVGEVTARQLQARLSALELASRTAGKAVFNMSRQLVGLDKLHQSMLQLLESVETLENKVDRTVPDLQREISKMEFNMAQMTSSISLLKEDQGNQQSYLKALDAGVSAMQKHQERDRGHLSVLQAQILNLTASAPQILFPYIKPETKDGFNSSSIWSLVQELSVVQRGYQQIISSLPRDCGAVQGPNGLYLISPGSLGIPLLISCDQETAAGGWALVQRRVDGSQDFNRKWSEYATGFGSPSGEFWLGNEALHHLTANNCSSLRVDLTDIYGKSWVAEYDEFTVSDARDGYRLHVAGYQGNASDALEYQNRMQFSAIDSDRDISNTNCAANYEGGWWFSHCQHANLNGRYNLGLTWFDGSKNEWIAVGRSEMRVRRRPNCNSHESSASLR
ncbi:hypothetical protein B7P43_G06173 [Cryptotermes secundus]|uniref:Fibrinogen C-terminal domain-containing protein n=1 Tax=Cryptotermes secundus TaxID=105785 RepID=A0A2J7QQM2_9NEOP|nr:protein scabrous [Cryptotermes secundus]PNF30891.1 hypothetical protein B7P43_G06173 [Cryptotermes secundus]